jgi:hypothetical protein
MTPYAEALEWQLATLDAFSSQEYNGVFDNLATNDDAPNEPQPAAGWMFRRILTSILVLAEPFWVAPDVVGVVAAAAVGLPDETTIDRALFPSEAGFVWLAAPVAEPSGGKVAAFVWAALESKARLCFLGMYRRPSGRDGLVPLSLWEFPFGDQLGPCVPIEGQPFDPEKHAKMDFRSRLAIAFLLFAGQRLVVVRRETLDRAARRRLERTHPEHQPIVRVVELRARDPVTRTGGDPHPVDWSCRWLVRGHWRRQWFPLTETNRPIWVDPHLKGPEGKPLKTPRATVFAVVR